MTPSDLALHFGPAILGGAFGGAGAYFGVKYAIINHAQKIDSMLRRQDWLVRKICVIVTQHNASHPACSPIALDDFPAEIDAALRL
jgi:hypothetical protein